MNKERKHINALFDKLPVHKPDAGLWERINKELGPASVQVSEKNLSGKLPVHKPELSVWNAIEKSLPAANTHWKLLQRAGIIILLFALISSILYFGSNFNTNQK
nr:hypothetical protein [Bacteroidota bacterium]